MKLSDVFIGRPVYWAIWAVIIAILATLGLDAQHVKNFVPFQFVVLGLAAAAVAAILFLYRPGERLTREPLDADSKGKNKKKKKE
ncbi:MAG: hypothetical protein Kow0032_29120 [Methyloligellaceae bacterium]